MSTKSNRAESPSRWRRLAQLVLGAGAVLAVAAAFGPIWVIRVGIGIAIVAGVLAAILLWRQVRTERQRRAAEATAQAKSHGVVLSAERTQHISVLSSMETYNEAAADRVRDLGEVINDLQAQLTTQQLELSGLRGNNAALKARIAKLEAELAARIAELRTREAEIEAREAELRALIGEDAELVTLPRRMGTSDWDALPSAKDIWNEGDFPTVVDLQTLALGGEPAPRQERRQA